MQSLVGFGSKLTGGLSSVPGENRTCVRLCTKGGCFLISDQDVACVAVWSEGELQFRVEEVAGLSVVRILHLGTDTRLCGEHAAPLGGWLGGARHGPSPRFHRIFMSEGASRDRRPKFATITIGCRRIFRGHWDNCLMTGQ
jgi:hypothetical protein